MPISSTPAHAAPRSVPPPRRPPPPLADGPDDEPDDRARTLSLPPHWVPGTIPIADPNAYSHRVWATAFGVGAKQARRQIAALPAEEVRVRGTDLYAVPAAVWAALAPKPDD